MNIQRIEKVKNLCLCKRCFSNGYIIKFTNDFYTVTCPNNCNIRILSKNKDFVIATWNRENKTPITDYKITQRSANHEPSTIMR